MMGLVEAEVTRDGRTPTTRRLHPAAARMDARCFTAAVGAHRQGENSRHLT